MKKISWQAVVITVLAAVSCVSLYQIFRLSDAIDSTEAMYLNRINALRQEISALNDTVDSVMKKQASLLTGAEYTLGELDTDTHTVQVKLKIVPKTVSDDTAMTVEFDGVSTALERDGGSFVGVLSADLFAGYDEYPLLTVTGGGESKNEYLESVDLSYLHSVYLPILMADALGGVTFSGGEVSFTDNIIVNAKPDSDDGAVTFVKCELVVEQNGVEIARSDITGDIADGSCETRLTGSYPAKEGDEIAVYAVAEDSLGYVHKALAEYWKEQDGTVTEVVAAGEHIYDKEGNLLN